MISTSKQAVWTYGFVAVVLAGAVFAAIVAAVTLAIGLFLAALAIGAFQVSRLRNSKPTQLK